MKNKKYMYFLVIFTVVIILITLILVLVNNTKSSSSNEKNSTVGKSDASSTNKTSLPTTNEGVFVNHVPDFKIRVVDKKDNPVANLNISITHITGSKYNYSPDLGYTDNKGYALGCGEYKKYKVKIRDISDDTIYNEYISEFEIEKENQTFTFVWPYELPEERKKKEDNSIILEFKKDGEILDNLHIELYVGHYETNERWTTTYPKIIDLGFTDKEGKVIWDVPKNGKYTIFTYLQDGKRKRKYQSKLQLPIFQKRFL